MGFSLKMLLVVLVVFFITLGIGLNDWLEDFLLGYVNKTLDEELHV